MNKDYDIFDCRSLKYLGWIINEFNNDLLIVISSTWRRNINAYKKVSEKIVKYSDEWFINFAKTGVREDAVRGKEIEDFMKEYGYSDRNCNYVIIDDDDFDIINYDGVPDYSNHFVKCDCTKGFKRKEFKRTLKILRGEYVEPYRRNLQSNERYNR